MQTKSIFPNITRAMREKGLTIEKLARELTIGRPALSEKLSGKFRFTLDEAFKIRDVLLPDSSIEELFQKKD